MLQRSSMPATNGGLAAILATSSESSPSATPAPPEDRGQDAARRHLRVASSSSSASNSFRSSAGLSDGLPAALADSQGQQHHRQQRPARPQLLGRDSARSSTQPSDAASSASSARTVSGAPNSPCSLEAPGSSAGTSSQRPAAWESSGAPSSRSSSASASGSRLSTRPNSRRVQSYGPGMVLSAPPSPQTSVSPASALAGVSSTYPDSHAYISATMGRRGSAEPVLSPVQSSSRTAAGLLQQPPRPHSSSISLPLTGAEESSLLSRRGSGAFQRLPSSLRSEVFHDDPRHGSSHLPEGFLPQQQEVLYGSPTESELNSHADVSNPSSLASQLPQARSDLFKHTYQPLSIPSMPTNAHIMGSPSFPFSPPYRNPSQQHLATGFSFYDTAHPISPPHSRQSTTDSLGPHLPLSPASAQSSKGKGRSRNASASSSAQDHSGDPDASTDADIITDIGSEAGGPWDVRETTKLRSAKDALGRRMINQYVRVADLGRGVHGRVWLCEDIETGQFYAIKSVNRENKKQRSLKRSQAEAEAARRQLQEEELEQEANTTTTAPQSEDERSPSAEHNASFEDRGPTRDVHPHLSRRNTGKGRLIVMDEKVRQEIAIMKRCHHPHVVQLREVIDDQRSKKIFMVLEYMPGGQVEWTRDDQPTLTVDQARNVFRDVVLGLEYLHYQGIIHRDIKPANLLYTQDRQSVKISDFGVSHVSDALARSSAANPSGGRVGISDDRALRKTEGSPAFFAPELCAAVESTPVATPVDEFGLQTGRPDYFRKPSLTTAVEARLSGSSLTNTRPQNAVRGGSSASVMTISPPLSAAQQQAHKARKQDRPVVGKGIDVWALGVTLYCLLFGVTPFHEATSEYELYNMIPKKEITIPPTMGADRLRTGSGVDPAVVRTSDEYAEGREVVDLLSRLLEKDPTKRIQLHEVKKHPWVLRNLRDSSLWLAEHDLAVTTNVVHVTEKEVRESTVERTAPQVSATGLKASIKRFGDIFGFSSGHAFLRRSATNRRDRSKSVSSTSASIATTSAWDGRSEPASQAASRHPSIVKKKPSTFSSKGGDERIPLPEHSEVDSGAFVSHALALKRKLMNAKAAREAHESAVSVVSSSPPYTASHHPSTLSRSVSGESQADIRPPSRRPSDGLLQPPVSGSRRVSSGAQDSDVRTPAKVGRTASGTPASSVLRPGMHQSAASSSSNIGSDTEKKNRGLRGMWEKLRSGSRTPAAPQSPTMLGRHQRSAAVEDPAPVDSESSTRRASVECLIFSPPSSSPGPSSRGTDPESRPAHGTEEISTPGLSKTVEAGDYEKTKRANYAQDGVSDSSESFSDDFDEDEDYGEALSPVTEGVPASSPGLSHAPLFLSDAEYGWRAGPGSSNDHIGRFLAQHPNSTSGVQTPAADKSRDDTPKATRHSVSSEASMDSDSIVARPPARPPISRDGSIHKDYSRKPPPPSPGRLQDVGLAAGHVADDEDDDEEEEEVMIKPRSSRLRRGTDTSNQSRPPPPPPGYYSPLAHPGC